METLTDATVEALRLLVTGDATIWGIIGISFRVSTIAIVCAVPPALFTAFLLAQTPASYFLAICQSIP